MQIPQNAVIASISTLFCLYRILLFTLKTLKFSNISQSDLAPFVVTPFIARLADNLKNDPNSKQSRNKNRVFFPGAELRNP